MGKAPAFMFYVRDWLSDPQLRMCSFLVRGMWIDYLCYMWEAPERGVLQGTISSLARLIGATSEEMQTFMAESIKYNFASVTCNGDVTECNSEVTLINRRMHRDHQERVKTRKRVAKHRAKNESNGDCNGDVTPPSSSSSSSSSSKEKKNTCANGFGDFWKSYPRKRSKGQAEKAWKAIFSKAKADDCEQLQAQIMLGVERAKTSWSREGRPPDKVPYPASWLNARGWEDEPDAQLFPQSEGARRYAEFSGK